MERNVSIVMEIDKSKKVIRKLYFTVDHTHSFPPIHTYSMSNYSFCLKGTHILVRKNNKNEINENTGLELELSLDDFFVLSFNKTKFESILMKYLLLMYEKQKDEYKKTQNKATISSASSVNSIDSDINSNLSDAESFADSKRPPPENNKEDNILSDEYFLFDDQGDGPGIFNSFFEGISQEVTIEGIKKEIADVVIENKEDLIKHFTFTNLYYDSQIEKVTKKQKSITHFMEFLKVVNRSSILFPEDSKQPFNVPLFIGIINLHKENLDEFFNKYMGLGNEYKPGQLIVDDILMILSSFVYVINRIYEKINSFKTGKMFEPDVKYDVMSFFNIEQQYLAPFYSLITKVISNSKFDQTTEMYTNMEGDIFRINTLLKLLTDK
jgi:hypothetical protein